MLDMAAVASLKQRESAQAQEECLAVVLLNVAIDVAGAPDSHKTAGKWPFHCSDLPVSLL